MSLQLRAYSKLIFITILAAVLKAHETARMRVCGIQKMEAITYALNTLESILTSQQP